MLAQMPDALGHICLAALGGETSSPLVVGVGASNRHDPWCAIDGVSRVPVGSTRAW
jgi:hypothetical protein